jgi:hypothetical protein
MKLIIWVLICVAWGFHELLRELKRIQNEINHNQTLLKEYGHDPDTPAQVLFLHNVYASVSTLPILYWMIDFPAGTIGNHIGAYFDSIGCASASGMHFVGLSPRVEPNEPFNNAFPHIIVHHSPLPSNNRDLWINTVSNKCKCHRYCWNVGQPWETIIPKIRQIMASAVHLHAYSVKHGILPETHGLVLNYKTDIFTTDLNEFLPLFPDVAIHYRCSDNLFGGMGCLSFQMILNRIPSSAKYIYIFGEWGDRLFQHIMAPHNDSIFRELIKSIKMKLPNAIVVVKRGSNVYTTMAQFTYANITICSPSTFCFYPAIAREKTTYFPVGSGNYINTFKEINPNFHMLRDDNLFYGNFTRNSTTEEVIQTLKIGLS